MGDIFRSGTHLPDISRSAKQILSTGGRWLAENVWGRYAIALADDDASVVSLYRDPLGVCTLYYASLGRCWVFSTSLTFLTSGIPALRRIDAEYLAAFVRFGSFTTDRTPFIDVREVPPGTEVRLTPHGLREDAFWTPARFSTGNPPVTSKGRVDAIRDCLASTSAEWSSRAKSIAIELSGGIDSATVAAAFQAANPDGCKLVHFTYPSFRSASETQWIEAFERYHDVTVLRLPGEDYLPCNETSCSTLEAERPHVQLLHASQHAAVRAALGTRWQADGFGGDQAFYAREPGPTYILEYLRTVRICQSLRFARDEATERGSSLWNTLRWLSEVTAISLFHRFGTLPSMPPLDWLASEGEAMAAALRIVAARTTARQLRPVRSPLKALQILELVQCASQVDRGYRGASTDFIHPLLSQPLIEVALGLPFQAMINVQSDRLALRQAAATFLPPEIVHRQSKADFTGVYQYAIARNYGYVAGLLLDGWLATEKLVTRDGLNAHLGRVVGGDGNGLPALLNAIAVEVWMRGTTRRSGSFTPPTRVRDSCRQGGAA